mgnify:CR=1 FL=1
MKSLVRVAVSRTQLVMGFGVIEKKFSGVCVFGQNYLRQTSSQKMDDKVGFWKARSKNEKLST